MTPIQAADIINRSSSTRCLNCVGDNPQYRDVGHWAVTDFPMDDYGSGYYETDAGLIRLATKIQDDARPASICEDCPGGQCDCNPYH